MIPSVAATIAVEKNVTGVENTLEFFIDDIMGFINFFY